MSEEQRKFYGSLITECEYWEFDSETNKGKLYDKNGNEIPTYEDLQQENNQLKENNMSMQEEMVRTWKKVDLYKEVIEEAREYIEESSLEVNTKEFGNLTVCNSDDLLEILDKVKEMSNE